MKKKTKKMKIISPDGGPPSPTESTRSRDEGSPTSLHPTPAPRWPLKPGVLVHINRTHSLRSGLAGSLRANDTMRIHSGSLGFTNDRYRSRPQPSIVRQPIRPFRRGSTNLNAISNKEIVNQRAFSAVSIMHDEGMIARANRIRAIFGSQLKEPDAFPGILRDKTGEFFFLQISTHMYIHLFIKSRVHLYSLNVNFDP